MASEYGYSVEVDRGYDEAVVRTRLAVKAEGFSILTEMHVGGVLGPGSGDERQYLIIGSWAPGASTRKLDGEMEVAVHLPCNFVVQESGASAVVAALDPADSIEGGDEAQLEAAGAAREALARVLQRVSGT